MHPGAVGRAREERVEQVRTSSDPALHAYTAYVPTEGAVSKLRSWHEQGVEIDYLSSQRDSAGIAADVSVLSRHGFPTGRVLARGPGESYGDVVERETPDVLIEDDCESIGAGEVTYAQIRPDRRAQIKSIIVPEFGGIGHLPESALELLSYGR